ncbi:unnamed protein product [Protopolystoma xenopodis]|uniref:Uncharacterized protein n=1 Tax=Protopolystoma xenopodis TaxID=117903 RepID=A0A3S5BBY2_9PLAT|nr:unnamed protein product [Protopolystoma xenopodis]
MFTFAGLCIAGALLLYPASASVYVDRLVDRGLLPSQARVPRGSLADLFTFLFLQPSTPLLETSKSPPRSTSLFSTVPDSVPANTQTGISANLAASHSYDPLSAQGVGPTPLNNQATQNAFNSSHLPLGQVSRPEMVGLSLKISAPGNFVTHLSHSGEPQILLHHVGYAYCLSVAAATFFCLSAACLNLDIFIQASVRPLSYLSTRLLQHQARRINRQCKQDSVQNEKEEEAIHSPAPRSNGNTS